MNGIIIGYDDQGDRDGRPALPVHGHPFNRAMWAPQAEEFTSTWYRVITAGLRTARSGARPAIASRQVV